MKTVTKGLHAYLPIWSASLWLISANIGITAQTFCYLEHLLVTVVIGGLTLLDALPTRVAYIGLHD